MNYPSDFYDFLLKTPLYITNSWSDIPKFRVGTVND